MFSYMKFETAEHILFECESYEAKIRNLVRKLKSTKSSHKNFETKSKRKEFEMLSKFRSCVQLDLNII